MWPGIDQGCECLTSDKRYHRSGQIFKAFCSENALTSGCSLVKSRLEESLDAPTVSKGERTRVYQYIFKKEHLSYGSISENFLTNPKLPGVVGCKEGFLPCYSQETKDGIIQNPDICVPEVLGKGVCPLTRIQFSSSTPEESYFKLASVGDPLSIYISSVENFDKLPYIGFANSLHMKEGKSCLDKYSFD